MTIEQRVQRLWRAANGIEDAETAMRRAYRGGEINELGGYCIALCVRAMEREARA